MARRDQGAKVPHRAVDGDGGDEKLQIRDLSDWRYRRGRQLLNWIADLTMPEDYDWRKQDWNRPGQLEDFLPAFEDWTFDWLDVPQIIRAAEAIYEFPMVDRNPLPQWSFGPMTLLGDAAHAMYPIGSNGASQGILDARILAREIRAYGATQRHFGL